MLKVMKHSINFLCF